MKTLFVWLVLVGTAIAQHTYRVPPVPAPLGIKPNAKQIELGKALFFEKRLSQSGTVSCATCHIPEHGWSDGNRVAVGAGGRTGNRRVPTIINSSYYPLVFWDGRTVDNTTQALLPLGNVREMAEPSNSVLGIVAQNDGDVVERLKLFPEYVKAFSDCFDIDIRSRSAITGTNLGFAIAAFESTIVVTDTAAHRRLAGDTDALSAEAELGFQLFKTNCMSCHQAPLFTDRQFHNTGVEFAANVNTPDPGRYGVLPQRLRTAADVRAFKTPSLAEVGRRAPYMHNGAFDTLRQVVEHYNRGGKRPDGRYDRFTDQRLKPLGLSDAQVGYLATFLREGMRGKYYPDVKEPRK